MLYNQFLIMQYKYQGQQIDRQVLPYPNLNLKCSTVAKTPSQNLEISSLWLHLLSPL